MGVSGERGLEWRLQHTAGWATPDTPCFIIYTMMGLSLPLKLDNYLLCSRGDTAAVLPAALCSKRSYKQIHTDDRNLTLHEGCLTHPWDFNSVIMNF